MRLPCTVLIFNFIFVAVAVPARAQARRIPAPPEPPSVSYRPFFVVSGEQMAAKGTFNAVFGQSIEPFFGGGLNIATRSGVWIEASISRFHKAGQRAFANNGQTFRLGIPLTTTITPIEVSAGYRFRTKQQKVWPYVGGGAGSYSYEEVTSGPGSSSSDTVSLQHAGFLAVGGIEGRVQRWVSLAADVQYTYISGILGSGGLSKDLGEKSLGGGAVRFKIIIGK